MFISKSVQPLAVVLMMTAACYQLQPVPRDASDVVSDGDATDGRSEHSTDAADAGFEVRPEEDAISEEYRDVADANLDVVYDAEVYVADVGFDSGQDTSDVFLDSRADAMITDVSSEIVCPVGSAVCGASCINTSSNPLHCGRCGGVCVSGATCVEGRCRISLTAIRTMGLFIINRWTWLSIRQRTSADGSVAAGVREIGTYGAIDGDGYQAFHNARLAMAFPPLPIPPIQVRRAHLVLTRAVPWHGPSPQTLHAVLGPCGPFTDSDYNISRWGSESLGDELLSAFLTDVPHALPSLERMPEGLRLRDRGGRMVLSNERENCLGVRSGYDLVDLASDPGFVPPNRSSGITPTLTIYPLPRTSGETAALVVEYAP